MERPGCSLVHIKYVFNFKLEILEDPIRSSLEDLREVANKDSYRVVAQR